MPIWLVIIAEQSTDEMMKGNGMGGAAGTSLLDHHAS